MTDYIRGGFEPLLPIVADAEDPDFVADIDDDDMEEFDIDEAMKVPLEDEDEV